MAAKNIINGKICSTAILESETPKAVKITYCCEIYGENFTVKKQWIPKSLIEIVKVEDGTIWFVPKNDWILDKKTKEYCQWIADSFQNIKHEIKTYLSNINNVVIDFVWR